MRDPGSYRGAKKAAAKAAGLDWKRLNKTAAQPGDSHVVVLPGSALDRAVFQKDPEAPRVFAEGGRERLAEVAEASNRERLWGVAYRGLDGKLYVGGPKGSHMNLRHAHGILEHDTDFEAGFLTSANRFVTRAEAKGVAIESGQIDGKWWKVGEGRELLSADVQWGTAT